MQNSFENHHTSYPSPGTPQVGFMNLRGLWTVYLKEVRRFFKVQLQTVWGPGLTALLFLIVFTVGLGNFRRVDGLAFVDFLAPGLIAMSMLQNSFANSSSSIIIGKIQGNIIDNLMAPLSPGELLIAYVAGAVTRAWLVGVAVFICMLAWPQAHLSIHHPFVVIYYGTIGAVILALLGVITGLWADKFDHVATVTNFIIQPLSLLSGTFFSVDNLHGVWRSLALWNPFYFIIDGFRYGFLESGSRPFARLLFEGGFLAFLAVILWGLSYVLLARGWKLKA